MICCRPGSANAVAKPTAPTLLKAVFSNSWAELGSALVISSTVEPRPFGYCSVCNIGTSSSVAERASNAELETTRLYTVWYSWARIHKTLKTSPAQAAGLTDKLWSMADIVALIEESEMLVPAAHAE